MRLFGIPLLEGGKHDGVHVLWTPPYPTGHAGEGFTLRRRRGDQTKPRRACFDVDAGAFATLHRYGHDRLASAEAWARSWSRAPEKLTHVVRGWTYRFDLDRAYDGIEIEAAGAAVAFAARAGDGRVVAVQPFSNGRSILRGTDIVRVWISTTKQLSAARICGLIADPDWAKSTVLVDKLQMPFAAVNRAVGTIAQEHALATSRLLPGERLDGDFETYSRCMNAALARPHGLPAWHVTTAQPTDKAKDFDVGALGYGLSLTLLASWRRALGLGWLDAAKHLTAGAVYDYRLEASVPVCDRDERRFDFHTVPRGYQLPIAFRLGPVMVACDRAPAVSTTSELGTHFAPVHKGVSFRTLTLIFDEPITSLVLHGASAEIRYRASMPGAASTYEATLRLHERTELRFAGPITELRLMGGGWFAGLSLDSVPAGTAPRRQVPVATHVYGIRFVASPSPSVPTSPAITVLDRPRAHAGFELSWLPPDHLGANILGFWPDDADSAPPTAIGWYEVQRAAHDGVFRPLRDELVVSTRNADAVDELPWFGFDVLARFPPSERPARLDSVRVRTRDIFTDDPDPIPWGQELEYRVRAVDAIGRRSPFVTLGRRTLEKRRRPPPPGSPAALRERAASETDRDPKPAGVQVRVIERATLEPSQTADRMLLGDHEAVAVVQWGWGAEERKLDPDVLEFRIYRHARHFYEVRIDIVGAAVASADGWQLSCRIDRQLDENELVGQTVILGERAFRILGHGRGPVTSLSLARSSVAPATVPTGTMLKVVRAGSWGSEPEHWDARVLVKEKLDPVDHEVVVVLDDWLRPSATTPRVEGWIGVTACDDADYVADRRGASESAPRSGNESPVAMARVVRRDHGRPTLAPVPLFAVSTVTLPRFDGDHLLHVLRPADHVRVPPGRVRVERCEAGPLVRSLVSAGDGVALRRPGGDDGHDRVEPWPLAAADATRLLAQLAAGPVEDHFLPHIAATLGTDADRLFSPVGELDAAGAVRDTLGNHRARYVYRLRSVDAGERTSRDAQVLPTVFSIPVYAPPPMPELAALESIEIAGTAGARIRVVPRGETTDELILFHSLDPRLRPPEIDFAWIRNRPDLTPERAAIVRDDRGVRLTATRLRVVDAADGREAVYELAIPEGHRVHVWVLAVSRAGSPSRLVGPHSLSNGVAREL